MGRLAVLVAALLAVAGPVRAGEVTRSGAHGAWAVFADPPGPGGACWIAAEAEAGSPVMMTASPVMLFDVITGEFSFVLRRGEFMVDEGTLGAGFDSFTIFFRDDAGWLRDAAEDRRALAALSHISVIRVLADEEQFGISMDGFRAALAEARHLCALPVGD